MVAMPDREQILEALLTASQPLDRLSNALSNLEWDCERTLVVFSRQHATQVVEKYLFGLMSGDEVVAWANLIESREDIDFELGQEQLLQEFVFELANPEINYPLNTQVAVGWIRRLTE